MSAWQDVFSLESWEILTGVRTVTNHEKNEVHIKAHMPVGKGADLCEEYVAEITKLLTQYHVIPKTDSETFNARIVLLKTIESVTAKYIEARGDEFQHKKSKKLNLVYSPKPMITPQSISIKAISVPTLKIGNIISEPPIELNATTISSSIIKPSPRRTAHHEDVSKTCIIPDGVRRKSVAELLDFESTGLGPMDQWIESLHKRTKKKTAHLERLMQSPHAQIDRKTLMAMAAAQHQDGKLYPGVILEKLDIYHRESEFDPEKINNMDFISDRPMDKAYNEWVMSDDSYTTPFFLWLEQHPITTAHKVIDKKYEQMHMVDYDLKNALVVEIKNCQLMCNDKIGIDDSLDEDFGEDGLSSDYSSGDDSRENADQKENVNQDSKENADQKENVNQYVLMAQKQFPVENEQAYEFPLNTPATITGEFSHCNKMYFKKGSTSYVWDINNENKFITHPHLAKKYHHSSLVKGEDVRCSGMWLVEKGRVKYIDNASGHYRCSPMRFFTLVKHLEQKGLVNEQTEICEVTQKGELGTLKLSQYYLWFKEYMSDLKGKKQQKLTDDEKISMRNVNGTIL